MAKSRFKDIFSSNIPKYMVLRALDSWICHDFGQNSIWIIFGLIQAILLDSLNAKMLHALYLCNKDELRIDLDGKIGLFYVLYNFAVGKKTKK